MVDRAGVPDASAALPEGLEADASGLETPPMMVTPAAPVRAGTVTPTPQESKGVRRAAPKAKGDALPTPDLTPLPRQEREAQRKVTPTELLRRGLLRSKRSAEGPAAEPPSRSPRSPDRIWKVDSTQPSRSGHRPPDRAETVAAILASHRRDGSEGAGSMTYAEFEQRAAMFVNPIRDGTLSIRIEAGKVQVGGIPSSGFYDDLAVFAGSSAGWKLLSQLASALNDKVLPLTGAQWASLPAPFSVPQDRAGLLQRRGRGADGLG